MAHTFRFRHPGEEQHPRLSTLRPWERSQGRGLFLNDFLLTRHFRESGARIAFVPSSHHKEPYTLVEHGPETPPLKSPVFYPHFTIGFFDTASVGYAVVDCFTILPVATGLTSRIKKMWVKDRPLGRG
jgi:hypothetical protein